MILVNCMLVEIEIVLTREIIQILSFSSLKNSESEELKVAKYLNLIFHSKRISRSKVEKILFEFTHKLF